MRHRSLEPSGPIFSYQFSAHTLSTAGPSDLFCVLAPSNSRIAIREIRLGQHSEFGDTQSELLSLRILTGSTATGGGTVISAVNVNRHSGSVTAASSVV